MTGYTKLAASILHSSIWSEDDRTRIVWITLLAMANQHGEIMASIPGVARAAGVPLEDAKRALDRFMAPDPYSRTPDKEGRRIEAIEGGWLLVNHAKYRAAFSREDEKAKTAARVARHRYKALQGVTDRYTPLQSTESNGQTVAGNGQVTQTVHIAEAEAEASIPPIAPQGGQDAPEPPAATPKPDPEPTPKPKRQRTKVPLIPADGFDTFWLAYPAKLAKTAAIRAWNAITPDAALADRIVADVQARRNSHDWTKDMGRFIPHPSTYLNQRRWEDLRETLAPVAAPGDRKPVGQMTEQEILEWATR